MVVGAQHAILTDEACGFAAEWQDVASSLETRLASVYGWPERSSFERALASVAISSALVTGDLDTVEGLAAGNRSSPAGGGRSHLAAPPTNPRAPATSSRYAPTTSRSTHSGMSAWNLLSR